MLQNAYLLAKIGADTAENEQHFAEILPKIGNYPTGRRRRARPPAGREHAQALACHGRYVGQVRRLRGLSDASSPRSGRLLGENLTKKLEKLKSAFLKIK